MGVDMVDTQLRKLRRRIEEFLRNTTPEYLIKIAGMCNIQVSETLKKRYMSKGKDK